MNDPTSQLVLASYLTHLVQVGGRDGEPPEQTPTSVTVRGTLLFADLSGFTALTESLTRQDRLGADRITVVLNRVLGGLVQVTHTYGGDVVKFAGDALLAVWRDDEDGRSSRRHALAALRCAGEMMRAVDRTGRALGTPLGLRVGVEHGSFRVLHLGEAEGRRVLLVSGQVVERSTHLGAAASPGEARIGPAALRMVAGVVQAEAVGTEGTPGHGYSVTGIAPEQFEDPTSGRSPVVWSDRCVPYIPENVLQRIRGRQGDWLAELRSISVVFVHLPQLASTVDPHRMNKIYLTVEHQVREAGGSINKLSVDEKGATVLCVFGLPPAVHEDDAARAVRAALGIASALSTQGIEVHLGVTTGRSFCGEVGSPDRREYTVIGDTVNTAARLMAKAPAGGVLTDSATARRAGGVLGFEALPPVRLKGKESPVPVFRPLGLVRNQPRAEEELVGRKELLARLHRIVESCPSGTAESMTLVGAPGTGKSATIRHLIRLGKQLNVPVSVLYGEESGGIQGLRAWSRCLVDLYPGSPTDQKAQLLADAGPFSAMLPLLEEVLPQAFPPTAESEAVQAQDRPPLRSRLLAELLGRALHRQPQVIAIEDGHQLDSEALAPALQLRSLFPATTLVVTSRPPPDVLAERFAELRGLGEVVNLENLEAHETAQLISRRLGLAFRPSEELVEVVQARTGGNPLFVSHLIDHLQEAGTLRVVEGRCVVEPGALERHANDLPVTLEGMLLARLDRLSQSAQLTLKVASVLGTRFDLDSLVAVHPLYDRETEVRGDLEEIHAKGIAQPVDARGQNWRFQHSLIRDATYDILPQDHRRVLHRAAATHAAALLLPDADRASYERVASHHIEAGDFAPAVRCLYAAAAAAAAVGRAQDVIALVDLADGLTNLHHIKVESAARFDRSDALGAALLLQGSVEPAALTQAEVLHALGEPISERGEGLIGETTRWILPTRHSGGALQIRRRASAHLRMARIAEQRGRLLPALFHALRSARLCRDAQVNVIGARALSVVGVMLLLDGRTWVARFAERFVLRSARACSDGVVSGLLNTLDVGLATDAAAITTIRRELSAATRQAELAGGADDRLRARLAAIHFGLGHSADALAVLEAHTPPLSGPDGVGDSPTWRSALRILAHLQLGEQPDEADVRFLVTRGTDEGSPTHRLLTASTLAAVAWAQGRAADAATYLDQALRAPAPDGGVALALTPCVLAALEVAIGASARGRDPSSHRRVEGLMPIATRLATAFPVFQARRYELLASLHQIRGQALRARWHAWNAERFHQRFGSEARPVQIRAAYLGPAAGRPAYETAKDRPSRIRAIA